MSTPRLRTAVVLAALSVGVPRVAATAQSVPSVDVAHLLRDLSVLAHDSMAGRETGGPGAERTRAYLVQALEDAGVGTLGGSFLHPFTWSDRRGVNVIAVVRGRTAPETPDGDVIVLTAHYDHLGVRDGTIYNGADDNASGVAALLEIGRHLATAPLRHTAILAFVDAEEEGLHGSRAFVAGPPVPLDRVALNVNLDMVSRTDGVLWASGAYHTPALRPVLLAVAKEAPLDLRLGHDRPGAPEGDDWTGSSDHAPFHRVGVPFVYFGVEDHPDYHEPTDDFEMIDPSELTAAVQTILMGVRALDAALPLDGPRPR